MAARLLREHGYEGAARSVQYCGKNGAADVVCDELDWLHIEVKFTEVFRLSTFIKQCEEDCQGKPWLILHKASHKPWVGIMKLEDMGAWYKEIRTYVNPHKQIKDRYGILKTSQAIKHKGVMLVDANVLLPLLKEIKHD
jgi:hypothetical protein